MQDMSRCLGKTRQKIVQKGVAAREGATIDVSVPSIIVYLCPENMALVAKSRIAAGLTLIGSCLGTPLPQDKITIIKTYEYNKKIILY